MARIQPKAIVLEYRLNGQDWKERIPILPWQDAERIALANERIHDGRGGKL